MFTVYDWLKLSCVLYNVILSCTTVINYIFGFSVFAKQRNRAFLDIEYAVYSVSKNALFLCVAKIEKNDPVSTPGLKPVQFKNLTVCSLVEDQSFLRLLFKFVNKFLRCPVSCDYLLTDRMWHATSATSLAEATIEARWFLSRHSAVDYKAFMSVHSAPVA